VSYRWVRTEPLKIFIGYDSKEPSAFHVLAHSILRRASVPVQITPLTQAALRAMGAYTRERGATESTEFSLTRFLVPYLSAYRGHAIFMDCDMLCQVDIAQIYDEIFQPENTGAAVLVCKHEYTPRAGAKFLGQQQTAYPRKNWSSFIVFDNTRCTALTPDYVNGASGLDLHRFNWLPDHAIGALPLDWNHLVGEYAPKSDARVLHYTLGGPWFPETGGCDHADLWIAELNHTLGAGIARELTDVR
jgi:hypothetical protein